MRLPPGDHRDAAPRPGRAELGALRGESLHLLAKRVLPLLGKLLGAPFGLRLLALRLLVVLRRLDHVAPMVLEAVGYRGGGGGDPTHVPDVHAALLAGGERARLQLRERGGARPRAGGARAQEGGVERPCPVLHGTRPHGAGVELGRARLVRVARKARQVDAHAPVGVLHVGSSPHLVEGVLVEGSPAGRVRDLLGGRPSHRRRGEARRVVVPRPEKGRRKRPSVHRGVVRIRRAREARERGGALAHAVRRGDAVRPPPALLGLVRALLGSCLLVRRLPHLLGEVLEALVVDVRPKRREVRGGLRGKRERAPRV